MIEAETSPPESAPRGSHWQDAADGVIERNRIDTIVLSNRTPLDRQFGEYFRRRYGEPERTGPALIFRVSGGVAPGD